jgi:hypothetical protein
MNIGGVTIPFAALVPLLVLQLILAVVAIVDIVRREPERVRGPKPVWILVALFANTIGPIIYFFFGRKE